MIHGIIGFAISAAFWPGATAAATVPRWAVMALLVSGLLVMRSHETRDITPAGVLGLVLFGWAAASLAWTSNPYDGVGELLQWAFLAAAWCLGANTASLRPIVIGFGLGISLSSVFAIMQAVDHAWIGQYLWPRVDGFAGLFVNQNTFAEAGALALVAAVGWRVWWLIPGILPSLIITESRTAKIAVLAAVVAWLWPIPWRRWAALAAIGVAIAAVYISGYKHGSNVERWAILQDIWQGLRFWGYGIGSFQTVFPTLATHVDTFTWHLDHAHNDFLEIAFELGIPGLALATGILAYAVLGIAPARYVVVAFAAMCALDFASHLPATGFLGLLCAGHATRHCRSVRQLIDDGGVALQRRLEVAVIRSRLSICADVADRYRCTPPRHDG